ncbi:hypothetical protein [Clostridium sp. HMP27]|uniref:hypothetical protein n=1 Tax=Clostridium sp. HMP27 TaxID=1487921 RepID=UPI00052BFC96|nr:hypothetical protein [Clostridium sp. HMP27]KGK88049.1 hypothetical protein DP68_08980 [Clostridium sp. HMP27]
MKIVEQNEGQKIQYRIKGNVLSFDEAISINLSRYQKDEEVLLDLCLDNDNQLVVSPSTKSNYLWYLANIKIPSKDYEYVDTGKQNEDGSKVLTRVAKPLNVEDVTLILWSLPIGYLGGAL